MVKNVISIAVYLYELFSNDDIVSTLSDKYMDRSISSRSVLTKTGYNKMDLSINIYSNDFVCTCVCGHANLYGCSSYIYRRNLIYNYFCKWLCQEQIRLKIPLQVKLPHT